MALTRKCLNVYELKSSYCCKSLCTWSPLVKRLLKEPPSNLKATLDVELQNSSTFQNRDFSLDAIVTPLISSSPAKANLVVEWRFEKLMKEHVKSLNPYSELISLCGKTHNVTTAMQIFNFMETKGLKPNTSIFNTLLSACLSSGNLVTALSLFEVMERSENYKSNSETYNAFISAYANMGNKKAMEAWLLAKKNAGFPNDAQSDKSRLIYSINSRNYLESERLYREMLLSGVIPDTVVVQKMLMMYCEVRNFEKVKEFVILNVLKIDNKMAEKIVGLYYELGTVDDMEELLVHFTRLNQGAKMEMEMEILSLIHSAIIRILTVKERIDDVEYAVGRMLKNKITFKSCDDVEKVICLYFKREAYDRLDLLLECIKGSYKFTRSTYDLLIAGYRRAGLVKRLELIMDEMKLNGFF